MPPDNGQVCGKSSSQQNGEKISKTKHFTHLVIYLQILNPRDHAEDNPLTEPAGWRGNNG